MFTKVNDFYLRPNFSSIICGSSKSGKSELVRDIIKQWGHVVPDSTITRVSFLYEAWQPSYDEIILSLPSSALVESHLGLPSCNEELPAEDEVEVNEYKEHRNRPMCRLGPSDRSDSQCHIVIVDDLLIRQKKNSFLTSLFGVFCHHYKISTFLITQQLYTNSDLNRSLAANVEHIFILKSSVASGTLRTLQNQYFSGQTQFLLSVYRKIVARGGKYVHIDLTSECNDNRRVKCGVLNNEVIHTQFITYCRPPQFFNSTGWEFVRCCS